MPDAMTPSPPDPLRQPSMFVVVLVLVGCALPIWCYLGGPPLTDSSDGRYAMVSAEMAASDSWLVPTRYGKPHVTKPPLTYWTEAAAIRVFGKNEFAVRFPSAVAGTLTIIGVFLMGSFVYGRRIGLVAACVLSTVPLFIVVSRLTLTDGLLSAFWFMSLCGGYLSLTEPKRLRGPLLLWGGVALGWLTKPLAPWGAVGIVLVWTLLAGHWKQVLRPAHWIGFVVSLAPVALWVYLAMQHVPHFDEVWHEEVLERAQGGGRHDEPFWFFIPVFLVGFFPCTTMMDLPIANRSLKDAWAKLRSGGDGAFWALATAMPLIAFSIPSGKLPPYILPAAAPFALITAKMLRGWLTGEHEIPPAGYRPPEVKGTLAIAVVLCGIGAVVGAFILFEDHWPWLVLPLLIAPAATVWLVLRWGCRYKRARALVVVWIALVAACCWGDALATWKLQPRSSRAMFERIEQAGLGQAHLRTYGHRDFSLAFYCGQRATPVEQPDQIVALIKEHGRDLVLIASPGRWEKLARTHRSLVDRFDTLFEMPNQLSNEVRLVLQPKADSVNATP